MGKIKIFLASSSELRTDREQFEIYINRKNKEFHDKGVFLDLIIWEDFLDAMSQTRLQDEYNAVIRDSHIFVMLFFTKVGKYTREEFENAFGQFKKTKKPLIYTYFKDALVPAGGTKPEDKRSLEAFKEKLDRLGHFITVYKTIDGLKLHFEKQLDKLTDSGFIELKDTRVSLPVIFRPKSDKPPSSHFRELIDVREIIDFEKLLEKIEMMISGEEPKKIMLIVTRNGHGKTSLLRKMDHYCQSNNVPSCLIDLSETYDFPHLDIAREICETLQISNADSEESLAFAGTVDNYNNVNTLLNNQILQSEDMKRRLTRKFTREISSAQKPMVCLFDTFDAGTRIVKDWLVDAFLRPIREGKLKTLVIIIAGSAWPQKINDVEWETHVEFVDRLPEMKKHHLLEFAESIGCKLSAAELDTCWLSCGEGKPLLMNMFVKNLCRGKRASG